MKTQCILEINGKIARLTHSNGRIIAEMLYHGPLEKVVENCDGSKPILNGRPNIFRGELFQLAGYEVLDVENERIIER